jgi:ATP-dependent DNA helicase RecQ
MPALGFVFHYSMPLSPAAYYDETARAARDGAAVQCVLFAPLPGERFPVDATGRRHASDADIRAVYEVLDALGDSGRALPTLEVKAALAGVDPGRVNAALEMLKHAGVIKDQRGAQVRLALRGLSPAALATLADERRARQALDRDRLARMRAYVNTTGCRWRALLTCLEETVEWERCGRCDNCRGSAEAPGWPRAQRYEAADNG